MHKIKVTRGQIADMNKRQLANLIKRLLKQLAAMEDQSEQRGYATALKQLRTANARYNEQLKAEDRAAQIKRWQKSLK